MDQRLIMSAMLARSVWLQSSLGGGSGRPLSTLPPHLWNVSGKWRSASYAQLQHLLLGHSSHFGRWVLRLNSTPHGCSTHPLRRDCPSHLVPEVASRLRDAGPLKDHRRCVLDGSVGSRVALLPFSRARKRRFCVFPTGGRIVRRCPWDGLHSAPDGRQLSWR